MRRRRAEGSIYTGKCQDTKWWSSLPHHTSTFIVGLVYFFSVRTFLILAIITAKIVYLGFLASRASRVALIMQISRVLSLFRLSIVSYIVSYLGLDLVLGIELQCQDISLCIYEFSPKSTRL